MDNHFKNFIAFILLIFGTHATMIKASFKNNLILNLKEAITLEPAFLCVILLFGIIYTIIPFIVRLINRERLNLKSGLILCTLNNVIIAGAIIAFLKTTAVKQFDGSANPMDIANIFIDIALGLAIIFYIINLCIFVDKKNVPQDQV